MNMQHVIKINSTLCEILTVNDDASLYCKNLRWNDKILVIPKKNRIIYRSYQGKMQSSPINN